MRLSTFANTPASSTNSTPTAAALEDIVSLPSPRTHHPPRVKQRSPARRGLKRRRLVGQHAMTGPSPGLAASDLRRRTLMRVSSGSLLRRNFVCQGIGRYGGVAVDTKHHQRQLSSQKTSPSSCPTPSCGAWASQHPRRSTSRQPPPHRPPSPPVTAPTRHPPSTPDRPQGTAIKQNGRPAAYRFCAPRKAARSLPTARIAQRSMTWRGGFVLWQRTEAVYGILLGSPSPAGSSSTTEPGR